MRWFASPHLPLALPPRVGRPCTCAMPHTRGGEMRESETRLRNARRACTCCPESDDTCAPVRVATSRVDPPATRWPTMHLRHAAQGVQKLKVGKLPAPSSNPQRRSAQSLQVSRPPRELCTSAP